MTREQLAAWCALEGLGLYIYDKQYSPHGMRVVEEPLRAEARSITYVRGYWNAPGALGNSVTDYTPYSWNDVPEESFVAFVRHCDELLTKLRQA